MKKTKEQLHEEQVLHEMSGCAHFTGIQNAVCKAGVNIRELVGGADLGWAARLPCLLMDADKCTTPCDLGLSLSSGGQVTLVARRSAFIRVHE